MESLSTLLTIFAASIFVVGAQSSCEYVKDYPLEQECIDELKLETLPSDPEVRGAIAALCIVEDCSYDITNIYEIIGIKPDGVGNCDKIKNNLPKAYPKCISTFPQAAIAISLHETFNLINSNSAKVKQGYRLMCAAVECLNEKGYKFPENLEKCTDCLLDEDFPDTFLKDAFKVFCPIVHCILNIITSSFSRTEA
ncbi:UNVERIFIED_CONTAM: hypothetical protein RMT77_019037 [Armadillidium vulgare]